MFSSFVVGKLLLKHVVKTYQYKASSSSDVILHGLDFAWSAYLIYLGFALKQISMLTYMLCTTVDGRNPKQPPGMYKPCK